MAVVSVSGNSLQAGAGRSFGISHRQPIKSKLISQRLHHKALWSSHTVWIQLEWISLGFLLFHMIWIVFFPWKYYKIFSFLCIMVHFYCQQHCDRYCHLLQTAVYFCHEYLIVYGARMRENGKLSYSKNRIPTLNCRELGTFIFMSSGYKTDPLLHPCKGLWGYITISLCDDNRIMWEQ